MFFEWILHLLEKFSLSLNQIQTCFLSVLIYINKQRLFKVTRIISKKSTRKLKMFAYNFKKVTRVKSKLNVLWSCWSCIQNMVLPWDHSHIRTIAYIREKMRECEVESASGPNGPPQQSENISILIMNSKVLYFVSNRKSDFMIIIFYIFIYLYFAIKTTPIKENVFDTYSTIKNYMYLYAFFWAYQHVFLFI